MNPMMTVIMLSGLMALGGVVSVSASEDCADEACEFPTSGDNSLEPTVTKEESQLLKEAFVLAQSDTAGAIKMLQSLEKPEEASAAIDFAIGNFYFQDGKVEEAETAYETALKKMPKFRSAIKNLGRVYLLQDKLDDSIALYQQLIADGQADADILLLTGHALLMQDYPVSAGSAYRQSLLMRQKNHDAMLGLAKALMQQARYAEGLAMVNEVLKEDPANRELWELRANAYLSTGDHDAVIRSVETAERLGCSDPDLLAMLGDLYLNKDQPADALRVYDACFSGDTVSAARLLRAVEGFLMLDELEGAQKMIERATAAQVSFSRENQVSFLRLKGEMAMRRNLTESAIELCREVLELDPLDGRTMLLLAEIEQGEGLMEEAVMTCERAARIPGYEVDALTRQAQIEVGRERYTVAVTCLEAAQTFKDQPHVGRYLDQLRRMVN